MSKKILMVAGPNGAGKTTMTLELMRNCSMLYEFVNADEIARGLAPKHPESVTLSASKLMIKRLNELLDDNRSVVFETTASGTNYIKHLKAAKAQKYAIYMCFLWLCKPEEAVKRVAQRVTQGGHNVPEKSIVRRYYAGIKNFILPYLPLADDAVLIDNSVDENVSKKIIARKTKNNSLDILDKAVWRKIEEIAYEQ